MNHQVDERIAAKHYRHFKIRYAEVWHTIAQVCGEISLVEIR